MKLKVFLFSLIHLVVASAMAQNYKGHWVDDFGVIIDNANHRVTKEVSTDQWGDAGANLFASLPANQSGSIFFTAPNDGDLNKAIGFDEGRHTVGMLDEIDYCFYLEDGEIYVFENGQLEGYYGTYSAGDDFEIQSDGSDVFFIHDGFTLTEITLPSAVELFGACAFYNSGAYFEDVETDFGGPYVHDIQVENCEPGLHTGSIILSGFEGVGPYDIRWTHFTADLTEIYDTIYTDSVNYRIDTITVDDPTDTLLGLASGVYQVEIEDNNGQISNFDITVSQNIPFYTDDSIDIDTTDWTFQGVGTASDWGEYNLTAGLYYSKDVDGGLSFRSENNTQFIIGLRKDGNSVANELSGLDYGMLVDQGEISVRISGTTYTNVETCDQSDVLSIEIDSDAGMLYFNKNGDSFKSANISSVSDQFLVDASIYEPNSSIDHLQFWGSTAYIYLNYEVEHSTCLVPSGSITITPQDPAIDLDDFVDPMWYDWNGNLISRNTYVSGLGAGEYHLILPYISPGIAGFQYYYAFPVVIGNKVTWEKDYISGLSVLNELHLVGAQPNNQTDYYAVSRNRVASTEDAWITFDIPVYKDLTSPSATTLVDYNSVRLGFTEADKAAVPHLVDNTHGHYIRLPRSSSGSHAPNGVAPYNGVYSGVACFGAIDPAQVNFQESWKIERQYYDPGGVPPYYIYTVSSSAGQQMDMTVELASCNKTDQTLHIGAMVQNGPSQIRNIITSMGCEEIHSYHKLLPELKGDYRDTYYDHFFFIYEGEYNAGNLDYELTNVHGTVIPTTDYTLNSNLKTYGDNRFVMDLGQLDNGYYLLTVTNEKKENYYLRIKKEL